MTKTRKKTADSNDAAGTVERKQRAAEIPWAKNIEWTWRMIDYLEQHPEFRRKLFSDTTKEANQDQRKKNQGKDQKNVAYAVLAQWVFDLDNKDDEDLRRLYKAEVARYNTSVAGQLARLKKRYQSHCKELGETGAGLAPEDVQDGSALANAIETIRASWPFWDRLHALWRELPNYNPIGVSSSSAGQDHASRAASLWEPNDTEDGLEGRSTGSGIEDMPFGDDDHEGDDSLPTSPKRSPRIAAMASHRVLESRDPPSDNNPPDVSQSQTPAPTMSATSSTSSTSRKLSTKGADKKPRKRTVHEAFDHELELAETERVRERQKQASEHQNAKMQLKQRKLELVFEERRREQEARHRAADKMRDMVFNLRLAAIQSSPLSAANLPFLTSMDDELVGTSIADPSTASSSVSLDYGGFPPEGDASKHVGTSFTDDLNSL